MKKKIVLIDDDLGILEVLTLIFEEKGYEVCLPELTGDIAAAVETLAPNVILLDIWIADQDGRDIVKALRKNSKTKSIPIIMFSAKNDGSAIAEEAGADDFVAKPFDINLLVDKVERWAQHK